MPLFSQLQSEVTIITLAQARKEKHAGGRMMLKDAHALILPICEHATLPGREAFAKVMKLRALRSGGYPELPRWSNVIKLPAVVKEGCCLKKTT
jgi:hypothetical protein